MELQELRESGDPLAAGPPGKFALCSLASSPPGRQRLGLGILKLDGEKELTPRPSFSGGESKAHKRPSGAVHSQGQS